MHPVAGRYKDELIATAKAIGTPGRGILAADESTGTIGKRLAGISVENNHENRVAYRELLFTAPDIEKHISGVIMYDETARDSAKDGTRFIKVLRDRGIHCGIKVDTGLDPLAGGAEGETFTKGLAGLAARCAEYYEMGCRFAKWRAVLKIGDGQPTDAAIRANARGLAAYGAICQAHGLVPIIEPEILQDGEHDIETCAAASERVLTATMQALQENQLLIEGLMLKPNMVTPGASCSTRATPEEVAWMTVRTLQRTIVPALPVVCFLSGGQSEEDASLNLNAINKLDVPRPWALTFSYGRAL